MIFRVVVCDRIEYFIILGLYLLAGFDLGLKKIFKELTEYVWPNFIEIITYQYP